MAQNTSYQYRLNQQVHVHVRNVHVHVGWRHAFLAHFGPYNIKNKEIGGYRRGLLYCTGWGSSGLIKKIINGHKKRENKKVAVWGQAKMGLLATCRGKSVKPIRVQFNSLEPLNIESSKILH